jgi:hypothetical protein
MEKKQSKKREKRMRLEEIIPDDELRTEMLSRLYKGDPILGNKGIFTNMLQAFVNAALEGEMDNFLEESKSNSLTNRRNGHTSKSVRSTAGPLSIQTPRDRAGDHEPVIVAKRNRELGTGLDDCLFQPKSIPVVQPKSIPFYLNKKGQQAFDRGTPIESLLANEFFGAGFSFPHHFFGFSQPV